MEISPARGVLRGCAQEINTEDVEEFQPRKRRCSELGSPPGKRNRSSSRAEKVSQLSVSDPPETHDPEEVDSDIVISEQQTTGERPPAPKRRKKLSRKESVFRRQNRWAVGNVRQHGNQLLSDTQEFALVGIARATSVAAVPFSRQQIVSLAREALGKSEEWDGQKWLRGFLRRHSDSISVKHAKQIKRAAIDESIPEKLDGFCDAFSRYTEQHHTDADRIINTDETWVRVTGVNNQVKFVVDSSVARPGTVWEKTTGEHLTMLPFVTASGKLLLVIYILPLPPREDGLMSLDLPLQNHRYTLRGKSDHYFIFTRTGYVTKDAWNIAIDTFLGVLKAKDDTRDFLLITDHAGAHMDIRAMQKLQEHHVTLLLLPSNTTHFLQPLDGAVFATHRRALENMAHISSRASVIRGIRIKNDALVASMQAEQHAFTETVIRGSFNSTGIWPFSRRKIMANHKKSVGATPPEDGKMENTRKTVIQMAEMAMAQLLAENKHQVVKKVRVKPKANRAFLTEDLIEEHHALEASKAAKAALKRQGRKVKASSKHANPVVQDQGQDKGK